MELVATWIGGAIAIITFVGALIKQGMDHATAMAELKAENRLQDQKLGTLTNDQENMKLDIASHQAHNLKQHEELYNSRNNMGESITKLSTILELMMHKQDQMDAKIDRLLSRDTK